MKILVFNAGSSSLKYQLLDSAKKFTCLSKGMVDRINLGQATFTNSGETVPVKAKNHTEAVALVLKHLEKIGLVDDPGDIDALGHRVVHGGEKYRNATIITPAVIKQIQKLCELAPLHNPPNLEAIRACQKIFKGIKQVAVFDTAFHQTLPEKAFLYALPLEYYKKIGIRRYGFHGTSHAYVGHQTLKLLNKKQSKIITCHMGNGSSVTAILNGKSIDTSMGFTPLEGIPMGTRSGDLDPAIVFKLMEKLKLSAQRIDQILNKESGLKGVSGLSSDMRDLHEKAGKNAHARLAISLLAYRAAKYIGGYAAAMNGLDAVTFTAGIGENAWYLRAEICEYLTHLGVELDEGKNRENEVEISTPKSRVKIYVIPTNEEKQIAMETEKLLFPHTTKNK